jgi:nitrogen regulatory protein PII
MSALSHIGRGIDKKLLTAVVRAGEGQRLVELFAERPGVLSVSHHHARGVGSQRIQSGQLYFSEKDVLVLLVETEFVDAIFSGLFHEGHLGEPGAGMIFSEKVIRGHPMMPFEGVDW